MNKTERGEEEKSLGNLCLRESRHKIYTVVVALFFTAFFDHEFRRFLQYCGTTQPKLYGFAVLLPIPGRIQHFDVESEGLDGNGHSLTTA